MEENGDTITDSMEQLAKQKARQAYIDWIDKMKERYS
nr:MAG TPA: Mitochondrial glycoprotein [Caudoviricetes sp.]